MDVIVCLDTGGKYVEPLDLPLPWKKENGRQFENILKVSWLLYTWSTVGTSVSVWTPYPCCFLQLVPLHCLSEMHRQGQARVHQDIHKGLQLIRSMPRDLHWYHQYPGLLQVNGTWKIYSDVATEDAYDRACWHKACSLTYTAARKVVEVSIASIHS